MLNGCRRGNERHGVAEPHNHLHDAKTVKCYINAHHSSEEIVREVIDKIMGESDFEGTPNDLAWAGKWQANL